MHELGIPPEAPASPEPDTPGVSMWVIGVAVAVALSLAAGLVWVVLGAPRATTAEPSYPDRWDRRVVPSVKAVQRLRGLKFQHPVTVRFQRPARFEKGVSTDEKDLTSEDRRELERAVGTLRALGLVSGDIDLFGAVNQANRSAILAYYSFEDQQITIRGNKLTPEVRSTLVHELTHALQDQHFGLGSRRESLDQAAEDGPSSTAASVLTALAEGDAMRVERRFRASLPPRQRAALDTGQAKDGARAARGMSKVPTLVQTALIAPYRLGSGLVEVVAADGGNRAVNGIFHRTPAYENALLDPLRVVTRDLAVRPVPLLRPGPGEDELDSGEFGALTWYLMLAERLPLPVALEAVDSWAGDTFLSYEEGGTTCVRLAVRGSGRAGVDRLHAAVTRWASSTPRTTRVSRTSGLVHLQSCDPGARSRTGTDASRRALDLVAARAGLGIAMLRRDIAPHRAHCLTGKLLGAFSVEQLSDPTFGAGDPAVQARIQQLAADCG